MPQRQNRYWYESQRMIAVRDLPRYTTIYYTDVSIEMQRHTWMLPFLRASLCKILISSFAHKMDFAHNFSVDFF